MYPYHNQIKKRIKNGELSGYEFIDNYKNSGERLILYFVTPPFSRPIKPERYYEYIDLLIKWKRNSNNFFNDSDNNL
ncbi:MAG: hypothetical protein LUG21_08015 [Clostridiales bacterium]|nr:hypothetical protein [Clostridiales bacterium]